VKLAKLAAGAAILSAALQAQTASTVTVISEESQVLVGSTLQMRAVVRDAQGNIIPNAPVTWSLNQGRAASVDSTGLVTARGLATIRVAARSGNIFGEGAIQTIPSRIEVTPGVKSMKIGGAEQFRAVAYDASGDPIPNVNFIWSLTNQRQGGSSLARVNGAGMVTATGEGGVWVWATYTYNEVFPGLQRQWVAYGRLTINVPQAYELRKLYSTLGNRKASWPLRARQSMIWTTDTGDLFFNASFGGLANAIVHWKDGAWRVLSAGGVPAFGRGSTALEFRGHAVTRSGKLLTYEDTNINGTEINIGDSTGLQPYLNNNVPFGETEATSGIFITRNSYAGTGWAMARANFRFENNTTGYTGLFRGLQSPLYDMLISTRERLQEVGGAAFTIDGDFGIAADGVAVYSVTSGARRIFFRHDLTGRKKLLAVGDELLGSTIARFLGGRGNSPSYWIDEEGTVVLTVQNADNNQYLVAIAPDGKQTTLRVNSQNGILYFHPAHGALIYANPFNNQGNGIYLWKGAGTRRILAQGARLFDETIQEIESGAIDKAGAITLMLRGSTTPLITARMSEQQVAPWEPPNPTRILFSTKDTVPVELPVNLFTLIGGARQGPPHAQVGGNAGSIAEFDGKDWKLTLGIGQRLFGNTMWFGGSHGATFNMRKAPTGDIYVITGAGIARIEPGGEPKIVLAFPLRIGTLTVNNPGQLDVNSHGAILFHSSTSAGDNRFFVHQNGKTKELLILHPNAPTASVLSGRVANSFDSFAIDDQGRVIVQLRFRNRALPTVSIWDGAAWHIAIIPGETQIGNHRITGLPNFPRASGKSLFAGLSIAAGGNVLAEWRDGTWEIAVNNSTVMPNGQVANSISTADVNTRGDALFQYANGVTTMVVRRGDKLHQVHNFFRPTADGDYLIRINSMDLRDDGTVYFLAVTSEDEVVLYQATPLF